jgi:hypothetical protein
VKGGEIQFNMSSLWNDGKIEYKNLVIASSMIDDIPWPLKLQFGMVGNIEISVPKWSRIFSGSNSFTQGSKIIVKDIFMSFEITNAADWKRDTIISKYQKSKEKMLQSQEEYINLSFQSKKQQQKDLNSTAKEVWSENKAKALFDNMTIEVQNIYFRIEDKDHGFSFGI